MDLVEGAKQLAELFEQRGKEAPETPAPAVADGALPLFHWAGVEPQGERADD